MGEGQKVAAYFDLDGTLLNASSEKTLTGVLARRRPWRIPHATIAWTLGATFGLLTGKAPYDALRNRGHLSLASWHILEQYSEDSGMHVPLFEFSGDIDSYKIMKSILSLISKQDALMLKMKYYYSKPSVYISRKLNITHVDVKIGRLKNRIKKLTGIDNIEALLEKYEA